jgi:hypothetical protein
VIGTSGGNIRIQGRQATIIGARSIRYSQDADAEAKAKAAPRAR